ncbi:hypothetical protein Tco_0607930 [Tanacetum coccineum]
MEKTQSESYISIISNDIKVNLNKEFLEELQKNTYHRWIDEDVIDHIAKVLEIVDLIRVPGTDSHQLRMKIFPLSLTDEARQWWIDEGKEKLRYGKNLLRNFSVNFIRIHTMEKMKPREGNIDEYWWRIYKSENLKVLESSNLKTAVQHKILLINANWRIYQAKIKGHSNY